MEQRFKENIQELTDEWDRLRKLFATKQEVVFTFLLMHTLSSSLQHSFMDWSRAHKCSTVLHPQCFLLALLCILQGNRNNFGLQFIFACCVQECHSHSLIHLQIFRSDNFEVYHMN